MHCKLIALTCLLAVSQARFIDNERSHDVFRILGGKNAKVGEFPHQVSLRWGVPILTKFRHICGGSIINDQWILTAAHCVKAYERYPSYGMSFVTAGRHDLLSTEWNGQWSFIESSFVHEKYDDRRNRAGPYDIGLIKLANPLEFNDLVAPISLPKKNSEPTGSVVLSGWGAVNNDVENPQMPAILQRADLKIINRKKCNQTVVKIDKEMGGRMRGNLIDETNICTLSRASGGCSGDSGGALIKKDESGNTEIVGIVSWTVKPCGRKGAPTVYVKVSSFIDWIQNIMSKN